MGSSCILQLVLTTEEHDITRKSTNNLLKQYIVLLVEFSTANY